MPVKIFLSASLRKYVPHYDPLTGVERTIKGPIPVSDLCRDLGIPFDTVKIAMVNGRRVTMDYRVEEDGRVAFFPPVGGG